MKPTALGKRITPEQMFRLVTDARTAIEQHRREMEASYYPERRRFELEANEDFAHRASGDKNNPGIFDLSNESLNIVRNVTRFMKARCSEDIAGSKPIFGVSPVGTMDAPLADQISRHGPWKLEQAHYSRMIKEGIGLALDLGETIVKTTHRTDRDAFERLEVVLVDRKTGEPVMAPLYDETGAPRLNAEGRQEGDYIYPEDPTMDAGGGVLVYEKAPEIVADDTAEFREVLIEEDDVAYHGLDVANVRFDALIAPLNVASLDVAKCVAHEFPRTVNELRGMYGNPGDEELDWIFEQLATMPDGPKTKEDEPRVTHGEISAGVQRLANNPTIKVTEVYLRDYDVFEDGRGRNIFMVLVADLEKPLYVEYLANITVKGRTPLHAVAVNRVPGRWYGRGFYKLYAGAQRLIDALLNGILVHNEDSADPLVFYQPDATEEGKSEPRLIRGPRRAYKLRPGKSAKDAVSIVEFPDLDERTWQLVQLIMQLVQTDSGVTSAAQGDYSALPSASTATGISSILQSASTLHRMLTEDLKDGFEPAILFGLMTIYAKQDKDETFQFLEGKAGEILSLASARVLAKMDLNVTILLTRFQLREQREQAQLVIERVLPQWVTTLQMSGLPLDGLAAATRPLFVQVAKGSDIRAAEEIFVLPKLLPVQPPAPTAEEQAKAEEDEAAAAAELAAGPPINVVPDAGRAADSGRTENAAAAA